MATPVIQLDMAKRIERLQHFLTELIDIRGVKQQDIANAIGKSHTYIWSFRKEGKGSEEFLQALERYMQDYGALDESEGAITTSCPQTEFIHTRDAKSILGLCKATVAINGIGAILGNAGTGKTHALKEYVQQNPDAVFIRANGMMSRYGILKAIAKAIGTTPDGKGEEMLEDIIEELQAHPRVLIVDEIEQLMPAKNITKIEILRTIHDETKDYGNSLIIAGPVWVEQKLKKRTIGENYGQIDSRIDYSYKTKGLSQEEILSIAKDYPTTDEARKHIAGLITNTSKGGIRWLSKLLKKCMDEAGMHDGVITLEVVKRASSMMML